MTEVRVSGLRVVHRGAAALDRVDLRVASGERVVVLGPSGAGKTTLLHALLGDGPREQGEVRVGGRDPFDEAERTAVRRSTGLVLQGGDLVPRQRVRTAALTSVSHRFGAAGWWAVATGRTPPGLRERLVRLAAEQGIEDLLDRPVGTLSGGQRRRVALVRALLPAPGLLLADEPTAGLDPTTAAGAVDALVRAPAGTTLLVTTHDPAVAARFDRVLALRSGRVVHDGPAPADLADLYARPSGPSG